MAQLYLVRHANAGERRVWDGDDLHRPLSKLGRKQSDQLAKRLAKFEPPRLLSSRYVRCIETLEPLGVRLGLDVEIDDRLTEEEPVGPALELIESAGDGTVMCSHGDVIPAVIQQLEKSGTSIRTPTDWRKASVWVLKRNKKGNIVHATVWPPPSL
jgi:8-oxo-dGTP diphosphatase